MNPDLVTLTNNKGIVKQVPRAQLSQYGLPQDYISQSDNYAKAIMSGNAAVSDVPAQYKGAVLQVLGQNNFSPKQNDTQAQLKIAQMGALPDATYNDLAKNNPQAALALSQAGYKAPLSATDKKTQDSTKGLLGLTDQLKSLYNEPLANGQRPNAGSKESLAKGGEGFLAPLNGALFNLTQVATNKNTDAKSYKRAKEGFTASLKQLTGDTGILTDQDYSRLASLLPDFGDSDKTAQSAWANIDQILKSKVGSAGQYDYSNQGQTPTGLQNPSGMNASQFPAASVQQPPQQGLAYLMAQQRAQGQQGQVMGAQTQQPQQNDGGIFGPNGAIGKAILPFANSSFGDTVDQVLSLANPNLRNAAFDAGQGKQVSGAQALGAAGEVASDVIPYAKVGALGKAAPIALNAAAGAVKGLTAPADSVGQRIKEGLTQGALGGALGGAFQAAPKVLQPFQTAKNIVGNMKQAAVAAAAGKTVSGAKVLEALQSGAEGLSPTVKQGYLRFLQQATPEFADKELPIQTAVKMATNANDAYSAAGKIGKAASAKFNDVLAKAVKGEIQAVAPKVSQANKLFSLIYGTENTTKKYAMPTIGAGLGYFALNKLLGQKGS